jgi:hypothetical protein
MPSANIKTEPMIPYVRELIIVSDILITLSKDTKVVKNIIKKKIIKSPRRQFHVLPFQRPFCPSSFFRIMPCTISAIPAAAQTDIYAIRPGRMLEDESGASIPKNRAYIKKISPSLKLQVLWNFGLGIDLSVSQPISRKRIPIRKYK